MTEGLEDKLIERFPLLYRPNNYGANQDKFCFECGDYLFDLIWDTSIKLEGLLKDYPKVYHEEFSVIQVKVKFTMFCFYVIFSDFASEHLDKETVKMLSLRANEICRDAERNGRLLNERQGVKI